MVQLSSFQLVFCVKLQHSLKNGSATNFIQKKASKTGEIGETGETGETGKTGETGETV